MKRNFPVLFIVIVTIGSICAAFIVSGPRVVYAYEVPSAGQLPVPAIIAASGSSQGYNFNNSFSSLISPFKNFFNSMAGGNAVVPVSLSVGSGNVSSTITIGINVQQSINQYINQADAWFYAHTGVHVQWFFSMIINIVYWAFGAANSAVQWIVGLFH